MCKQTGLWTLALLMALACFTPAYAEDIEFLMNVASQKAAEGHFRAAEKRYRAVLVQDAENKQATFGLATSLQAQGRVKEAIVLLETLIQQHSDFQPAYYLLGVMYESQGDLNRAKQAFGIYVAIAPTNVPPDPEIRIKLRSFGIF